MDVNKVVYIETECRVHNEWITQWKVSYEVNISGTLTMTSCLLMLATQVKPKLGDSLAYFIKLAPLN